MKKRFITMILLGCFIAVLHAGYGQSFTIAYGPAYTTTKQVVPVVNGQKGGASNANAAYVFSLFYEHFLTKRPISLFAAYSKFDGYTFVFFEKGGVIENGAELVGAGYNGVKIHRYDLGITYNLIDKKRKFRFAPFFSFGLQVSKPNDEDVYPFDISGPNYVETAPTSAEAFNTMQVVPSAGFRTGFLFRKRLDLNLSFQGVLGYKSFQKMYLQYEYKGTPQPTAQFEANGTGLFVTLGIGYRFARLISR